jgi:mono/diheme cytochrome c family protein
MCHGADGTLGGSGAKDLSTSTLGRSEVITVIRKGKGAMAGFAEKLTPDQVEEVADHVISLRPVGTNTAN